MANPLFIVICFGLAALLVGLATDSVQLGLAAGNALVGMMLTIDYATDQIIKAIRA